MGRFTRRLTSGVVAALAGIVPASLLVSTSPAHAADHYTVDYDAIDVGEFHGVIETWHDGTHLRATLTAKTPPPTSSQLTANPGCVSVEWAYADATESTGWMGNGCSSGPLPASVHSSFRRDIVWFHTSFMLGGKVTSVYKVAGNDDPPMLDRDSVTLPSGGFAAFSGAATYYMDTAQSSADNVVGALKGSLQAGVGQPADMWSWIAVTFYYADGTSSIQGSPAVRVDHPTADIGTIVSDASKDLRSINIQVRRAVPLGTMQVGQSISTKFGDV